MNLNTFRKSVGTPLSVLGVIYLHIGVLIVPLSASGTCTMGDIDGWLASLVFWSPLSFVALAISFMALPSKKLVRWFTILLVPLILWAYIVAFNYLVPVTFQGAHLCSVASGWGFSEYPVEWWFRLWAPVQMVFLMLCTLLIFKLWSPAATDNNSLNRTP